MATGLEALESENGETLTKDVDIAAHFQRFYTDLYAAQNLSELAPSQYLQETAVSQITPDQAKDLDGPIRIKEEPSRFSETAGFRINIHKSHTLNLPRAHEEQLSCCFPIRWAEW
ncbi:hypothetical protein NDU88_006278 [Pleurodeles waltl]|uniref:Uncharacterized protein n=1 Tax=Pleurodeles waltl TaxID=8319 RepID=A0AAV7RML6_PLEWA|nr:hypothetical protein NDU88_006278 [Pleurodeles waltl]